MYSKARRSVVAACRDPGGHAHHPRHADDQAPGSRHRAEAHRGARRPDRRGRHRRRRSAHLGDAVTRASVLLAVRRGTGRRASATGAGSKRSRPSSPARGHDCTLVSLAAEARRSVRSDVVVVDSYRVARRRPRPFPRRRGGRDRRPRPRSRRRHRGRPVAGRRSAPRIGSRGGCSPGAAYALVPGRRAARARRAGRRTRRRACSSRPAPPTTAASAPQVARAVLAADTRTRSPAGRRAVGFGCGARRGRRGPTPRRAGGRARGGVDRRDRGRRHHARGVPARRARSSRSRSPTTSARRCRASRASGAVVAATAGIGGRRGRASSSHDRGRRLALGTRGRRRDRRQGCDAGRRRDRAGRQPVSRGEPARVARRCAWCRRAPARPACPARCCRISAAVRCCGSCSTGSPTSASTSSSSRPARWNATTRSPRSPTRPAGRSCAVRRPTCSTGSRPRSTRIPADHVIRLTADCPLADPVLIESVFARHLDRGADYTSNVFPRTFPRGLDCEVMTAAALRTRARRGRRPGRARARHAVPLPPARAVRAREHAQRPAARARRLDRRHRRRSRVRAPDRGARWPTTTSRGATRGRRSVRARVDRCPDAVHARARGPGAQRVLPRVPQRRRGGAAQPLAPDDRSRGARALVLRR